MLILFMMRLNSRVPRWDPWGTPDKTLKVTEKDPLHLSERLIAQVVLEISKKEAP